MAEFNAPRESVWDYPRPPQVAPSDWPVQVVLAGETIADSRRALRVLETSHPPTYYVPLDDIRPGVLLPTDRKTFCEWKGTASYFHVMVGEHCVENAAWTYLRPLEAFQSLLDHVAFYSQLMDACFVDGERVQPQLGGFYGGWITSHISGPFKGSLGTGSW